MLMQGPWGPLLPAQRLAFQIPPSKGEESLLGSQASPAGCPAWVRHQMGLKSSPLPSPNWCGLGRGSIIQHTEHNNPFSAFTIHSDHTHLPQPTVPLFFQTSLLLLSGSPPGWLPRLSTLLSYTRGYAAILATLQPVQPDHGGQGSRVLLKRWGLWVSCAVAWGELITPHISLKS